MPRHILLDLPLRAVPVFSDDSPLWPCHGDNLKPRLIVTNASYYYRLAVTFRQNTEN